MIDIHTHILPHMDDGSTSLTETCAMLAMMKAQGVTKVVATSHYYADNEDPEDFLLRRSIVLKEIEDAHEPGISIAGADLGHADIYPDDPGSMKYPMIIPAAEVRYFAGCGRTGQMDSLRIGSTRFILIELPDTHFAMSIIDDLEMLKTRGFIPVIAHLNRCRVFNDNDFVDFCNEEGILIQLNTECILGRHQRKRAVRLMTERRAHFLGTDCHDTIRRPPNKKEALDIISAMAGADFAQEFTEAEERILGAGY